MSHWAPAKKTFIGKLDRYDPLHRAVSNAARSLETKIPDMPEPVAAPTIDDAQQNRNQQDRLRRRRGVLANIFGGAGGGTSTTLGG